jgi:hypothetical protein
VTSKLCEAACPALTDMPERRLTPRNGMGDTQDVTPPRTAEAAVRKTGGCRCAVRARGLRAPRVLDARVAREVDASTSEQSGACQYSSAGCDRRSCPRGVCVPLFLHSRGWFEIYTSSSVRGVGVSAVIATLFGAWQVCADLLVTRLPKDINVPPPQSLLFYPAMGYVVEVLFHAFPLALLLAVLGRSNKKSHTIIVIRLCIVCVSSLEPVLVHMRMGSSAYVGVFVFVFTVVELYVFRRYDFMSMYAFRLVFYMWWHITWGYLRLRWLF